MKLTHNTKVFVTSAMIAAVAVLVGGYTLGVIPNGSSSANAGDALPEFMNARDIGEGGLDTSSIELIAESDQYSVWTARDNKNNVCKIALATPEGNTGVVCVNQEQFKQSGLTSSMQVGTAEEGDLGITMLQTYLLPDAVDSAAVAELIPGSVTKGQLVVRYGPLDLDRTTSIKVPSGDGTFEMSVFGKDSI